MSDEKRYWLPTKPMTPDGRVGFIRKTLDELNLNEARFLLLTEGMEAQPVRVRALARVYLWTE